MHFEALEQTLRSRPVSEHVDKKFFLMGNSLSHTVHACVRGCLRDRHRVSADLLVGANPVERIKISRRNIEVFWKSS